MKNTIRKIYENDAVRYVFFGGCTTLVNLVCFYFLRLVQVGLTAANLISIIAAILFAYIVNSRFVFRDHCETLADHIRPFCKFIGARAFTMAVELVGVWLLVSVLGLADMTGKLFTQVLVLVLNYIFSKFFVFTGERRRKNK
ncbi:MAG: GtrA family protein [Clostridiales bacterium]|nr:GtrA family protein [Clostridiales bacterium]